jgi:hypothetical protein
MGVSALGIVVILDEVALRDETLKQGFSLYKLRAGVPLAQ